MGKQIPKYTIPESWHEDWNDPAMDIYDEGCQECGSGFINCDCQEYSQDDDWDDSWDEDYCCYDPRYTGPKDYCHCQEHTKAMEREMHWFWGRWDRANYWLRSKRYSLQRGIKLIFSKKPKASDSDDLPF